jgi:hypothetical protein
MYFRSDCDHVMVEDGWRSHCKKCKLRQHEFGIHGVELNKAEAEHGPFGARHAMFKLIGEHNGGINHFMLLDKDGKWIAYALNAACYYQLMEYGEETKKRKQKAEFIWDWPFTGAIRGPKYRTTVLKKIGGKKGWASRYYNWMANESPWKHCFVVKDFEQAYEDGILYTTKVQAEHLMSVMSGIRYISEFPHIPKAWDAAMEYTDSGMFSLLAAHYFQIKDGLAISATHSSNHAMWNLGAFDAKLHTKTFLSGKLKDTDGTMQDRWSWSSCIREFGAMSKAYDPWENEREQKGRGVFKLPDTGGKNVRDVFGGYYVEQNDVPVEEWIDQFQEEVYKWELKSR